MLAFVSQDSLSREPPSGSQNKINVFLTILEARGLTPRCYQGWFLLNLSWVYQTAIFSLCLHMIFSLCTSVSSSPHLIGIAVNTVESKFGMYVECSRNVSSKSDQRVENGERLGRCFIVFISE